MWRRLFAVPATAIQQGVCVVSSPRTLTVQRIYAEGRILAGYLTEETAQLLPEFARAPASDQESVRAKFGLAANVKKDVPALSPSFRHVDEPEAIEILRRIAPRCGGPPNLSNLVGFEWVAISPIIAGHYVAAPMPLAGRFPTSGASVQEITNYCMIGSSLSIEDVMINVADNLTLISPERLRLRPVPHANFGPQGGLLIEYLFEREPSPVTVLLLEDRVIALNHQERLVALQEQGIKEALCLVQYGYGMETLKYLPTINISVIDSENPPHIVDFTNEDLMVRIPVQTPATLITMTHQVIDPASLLNTVRR